MISKMSPVDISNPDENASIQAISQNHGYIDRCMTHSIDYTKKLLFPYLNEKSRVLEIGPAEGHLSGFLYEVCSRYEIVEPSETFSSQLKSRLPNALIHTCMIEDFDTTQTFDLILLSHVLEHVLDPVSVLKHCKQFMHDNTTLLCVVPNSHSVHRQAAVLMNLLQTEDQLNESDILHGHKRVYNMNTLTSHFKESDLRITKSGGYWLKPLSNSQIQNSWTDEMITAFMELGEHYPDIAAEIYVVSSL